MPRYRFTNKSVTGHSLFRVFLLFYHVFVNAIDLSCVIINKSVLFKVFHHIG